MNRKKKDYYQILGVPENATDSEIKKAFRKKARQLHPDRAGKNATRAFQEIQEAYEILSDREKRRAYDAERILNEHPRIKITFHASPANQPFSTLLDRCRNPKKRIHLGSLDVYLSMEEVRYGTEIHWSPTIEYPCPWCSNEILFPIGCPLCQGQGGFVKTLPIRVHLPPALEHGDRLHVEHHDAHLGVICLDLTIHTP